MCRFRQVVTLLVVHAARGLNPCLDPYSAYYVCTPAGNRIDLEGCGLTQDDVDNLTACLVVAKQTGVTELNIGYATDIVLDDEFFAKVDLRNSEDEDRPPNIAFGKRDRAPKEDQFAATFLEIARERFDARVVSPDEETTLEHLQIVRVPKAGSGEASVIARLLGGCMPRGPCCAVRYNMPGMPNCPGDYMNQCTAVTGCLMHTMGTEEINALDNPSVYSMSNIRDVVNRLVSGFFYGSQHAPQCAKEDVVDYEECFAEMTNLPRYQNIASRMFAGHDVYDGDVRVCLQEDSEDCAETLATVVAGACNMNIIIITELWQTSLLLLFETLPWLRPTVEFFPVLQDEPEQDPGAETKEYVVSHRNDMAKHNDGITHITPELREAASLANPVDNALHEFVSAKFCRQLQTMGLLGHPLVANELTKYDLLDQRCNDANWITITLERFGPLVPEDCRLYKPFTRP